MRYVFDLFSLLSTNNLRYRTNNKTVSTACCNKIVSGKLTSLETNLSPTAKELQKASNTNNIAIRAIIV